MDQNVEVKRDSALRFPAGALGLPWLPVVEDWPTRMRAVEADPNSTQTWVTLTQLAVARLDFPRTIRLDRCAQKLFADQAPTEVTGKPVKLAILGSSTSTHLLPAIRVAGLRRGLWIKTYEAEYGQYMRELMDPNSALFSYKPNAVLMALDAHHLAGAAHVSLDAASARALVDGTIDRLTTCWRLAREAFGCQIIQQTALPVFPTVLGQNEFRLPGSRRAIIDDFNRAIRIAAESEGVDILALDARASDDGVSSWHDATLWHRAKQEVAPRAAPLYGDLVGRLLAAGRGRSYKCIVLDLDHTLWGGVIGDDGIERIVIGQGSALGEAYVSLQHYLKDLMGRGVILAVCSKNDEENALAPFERHPDMVLRRSDFACFCANWLDKATNIRNIAGTLNIGLDSLVFLDDNPFERNLIRRELPMVAVPEVSDDPGDYARVIADAGYFEGLSLTDEDRERTQLYQANAARQQLEAKATDLPSYLRSLGMRLVWRKFDKVSLPRIVQLINKTNQFNLTTRRYTEAEVVSLMEDEATVCLQFRLLDAFGDNGIIAIAIACPAGDGEMLIDTWLMSCRVLGRQVEEATLRVLVEQCRLLGTRRLIGEYHPTAKNGMVKDHYKKLGFSLFGADNRYGLELADYVAPELFMVVDGGTHND